MSEKKIDHKTAVKEYERWCKAWKIGRKRKRMQGDELKNVEDQEAVIIELIENGLLSMTEKNVLHYDLEEPTEGLISFDIPRPKGDMLMEGDRFEERETQHRAYATIAAATGYAEKVIIKLEWNTDVYNLMAVIGHFLMA